MEACQSNRSIDYRAEVNSMRKVKNPWSDSRIGRLGQGLLLAMLGLVAPAGCTREFFREWANLDVSQAIFEKSRDPRFRIDMFSVDPPGLARFADPYDPDAPPAPPDDPVAEAISPVPQWPNHRLMMPVEGTGYLGLLEKWRDDRAVGESEKQMETNTNPKGNDSQPPRNLQTPNGTSPFLPEGALSEPGGPLAPPSPTVPPSGPQGISPPAAVPPTGPQGSRRVSSPNSVASHGANPVSRPVIPPPMVPQNSGPNRTKLTQIGGMGNAAATLGATAPSATTVAKARASSPRSTRDDSLVRTAMQTPPPTPGNPRPDLPPEPIIGGDPNPEEKDLSDPNLRRFNQIQIPPGGQFTQDQVQELAGLLVPSIPELTDIEAYGFPKGTRPYTLTMQQAFTLALINSRTYQSALESLYGAALNVTLQRFNFQPQFYAGMSPTVRPPGIFPLNPTNSFTYNTLEAPGGQVSTLQLGTVAGYGKLLNSGGQLLMGFANQLVFNFVGKTPFQPTVQSSLPITFVQPFLRNAGRAVVLENLTQAERSLLYAVRTFAKFRQEFVVTTLTGGTINNFGTNVQTQGFTGASNVDPTGGFIPVLYNFNQVDLDRRNVAAFEQLVVLYKALIEGEASGLSQLQVDQLETNLQSVRQQLVSDKLTYRNNLDSFKIQLGMPPDTPVVLDRALLRPFQKVFDEVEEWQKNKDRDLDQLPQIAAKLPPLEDVIVDGRSVLGIYRNYSGDRQKFERENEEGLEDILQAAVRVALEYRLDLMNNRAALYDSWRQIAVTANALKGYLNVTLTNQILTPPNTTNPFGFLDQAKQFNLVFNGELPLIRLAERNTFRAALINYQAAGRTLQNREDFLKNLLRTDVRSVQLNYIQYEIARRNFVLNIRLKDQAFETIIAPPQGSAAGSVGQAANAATQTSNLINFQRNLISAEQTLVFEWQQYELSRLSLYRDLGTLPYDEWEAFSELFPAQYSGPTFGPPSNNPGPPTLETSTTPAAEAVAR